MADHGELGRSGAGLLGTRWWLAWICACCVVSCAPLLLVTIPPLVDYPNHLARLYLLDNLAEDQVLSKYYIANWSLIPNLAMELLAPPLLSLFSIETAGRILVGFSITLFVSGSAVFAAFVYGEKSPFPVIVGGILSLNGFLLSGLLNFQISIGFALWAAAFLLFFYRRRRNYVSLALSIVCGLAAYFAHLYGFIFLLAAMISVEVARTEPTLSVATVRRSLLAAIALSTIPLILLLNSPTSEANTIEWSPLVPKISQGFIVFSVYDKWILVVTCVAAAAVMGLAALGRIRVAPAAFCAVAILGTLFALAPSQIGSTFWVDTRVSLLVCVAGFCGIRLSRAPRVVRHVVLSLAMCLFLFRTVHISEAWASTTDDIREFRSMSEMIQPGSRVLVVRTGNDFRTHGRKLAFGWRLNLVGPTYSHMGALVVLNRRSFWPGIFMEKSQQPISTTRGFEKLVGHVADGPLPSLLELLSPAGERNGRFAYLDDWKNQFDYLIVLYFDDVEDRKLLMQQGDPTFVGAFSALYRL